MAIPNTTCHCAKTQSSYLSITHLKQPLIIYWSFINYWQREGYVTHFCFCFLKSCILLCRQNKFHGCVQQGTKGFSLLLGSQPISPGSLTCNCLRTCSDAIWYQAFDSCFHGNISYLHNNPPRAQPRRKEPFLAQRQIFQQQFQKLLFSYMCNQYLCRCCCDHAATLSCAQECSRLFLLLRRFSLAVLWCTSVSTLLDTSWTWSASYYGVKSACSHSVCRTWDFASTDKAILCQLSLRSCTSLAHGI